MHVLKVHLGDPARGGGGGTGQKRHRRGSGNGVHVLKVHLSEAERGGGGGDVKGTIEETRE